MRRPHPATLAIALLALAIALHGLDRWPLYVAELWTWEATGGALHELRRAVLRDKHPPLQPLLVWLLRAVSDAEGVSRLPSALGALGGCAGLYLAIRREAEPAWARLGVLVLVLSPMWVNFAGIMRPYALMLGCSAGLLWAALSARDDLRRACIALAALGICGLYLHYAMAAPLGAALLGAAAGALARLRGAERRRALLALLASTAITILCFLPWFLWVGRGHMRKSMWASPSTNVFRYMAFEADDFVSFGMLAVVVLAVVGVGVALRQRRAELAGFALGAAVLPYVLSASVEIQVRVYALIGLLPLAVLLAVVGARWLSPRAGIWAALLAGLLGPEAWSILRLPSAPFGVHGAEFDDGWHDSERDMAFLSSLVPSDGRLLAPPTRDLSIFAHYAPSAVLAMPGERPRPGDWRLLNRAAAPLRDDLPGCVLEYAFTSLLHLPDEDACARVLAALASAEDAPLPWRVERAMQPTTSAAEREALLREAMGGSSPLPHLLLGRALVEAGRLEEARPVLAEGLQRALRWNWLVVAVSLLELRATVAEQEGEGGEALRARDQAECLRGSSEQMWLPHRCLWSVTAATVARKPSHTPASSQGGPPRGKAGKAKGKAGKARGKAKAKAKGPPPE